MPTLLLRRRGPRRRAAGRPAGTLDVADYKATAKADEITAGNIHPAYKRQLEMCQFLVASAGFTVDARSWLVYANAIKDAGVFSDVLRFRTKMIPVDCDRAWVVRVRGGEGRAGLSG